jgi:hypothetical protein
MANGRTREDLIDQYVDRILGQEGKPPEEVDRNYMIDLVAEVAGAVDGKKPLRPMRIVGSS